MENLNKDFTLVGSKGSDSTEKIAKPALSFFQDAWRRFKKNKIALVAMWIIAITLVFSVISAFVVPQSKANYFNPNKSQVYGNLPPKLSGDLPFWNGDFKAPGSAEKTDVYKAQGVPEKDKYVFGTDKYGRSLAKRTVVGLRISLIIALAAALIDLVIGVTYGIISGWMGGKVDMVISLWGGDYAEPSTFLDLFTSTSPKNNGKINNVTYDKAIKAAEVTDALDPEKHYADYKAAEEALYTESNINPLYFRTSPVLRNPNLKDVRFGSTGLTYDFKTAYLK